MRPSTNSYLGISENVHSEPVSRGRGRRGIPARFDIEAVEARGETISSITLAVAFEHIMHAFFSAEATPAEVEATLIARGVGVFAAKSLAILHDGLIKHDPHT